MPQVPGTPKPAPHVGVDTYESLTAATAAVESADKSATTTKEAK